MSKRGRKAKAVNMDTYIGEYYKKHRAELKRQGINKAKLEVMADNYLNKRYMGKTRANKAISDMIRKENMTNAEALLYDAKQEAKQNFNGDLRQFNNKKYGSKMYDNTYLGTDGQYDITLTGHYDISNSNMILAELEYSNNGSSPFVVWQYIDRTLYGI